MATIGKTEQVYKDGIARFADLDAQEIALLASVGLGAAVSAVIVMSAPPQTAGYTAGGAHLAVLGIEREVLGAREKGPPSEVRDA